MPINWDELKLGVAGAASTAAANTDARLAGEISSLTRMTEQEVQELFPEKADVLKLVELMEIVKSAENRNIKISRIVAGGEEFGGIMLTLLDKFV